VVCFGPALGEVRYLWCFAERDDAWDSIGSLEVSGDPAPTRDVLLERLRSGAGRAIDPRYRDLAVGEFVYRFNAQ
jgi:hypothetical protein